MAMQTQTTLPITIHRTGRGRKFLVELDRDKFERLAASLGLFAPEFLASLERAEKEIAQGAIRHLRSLRELRGK